MYFVVYQGERYGDKDVDPDNQMHVAMFNY